MTHHTNKRKSGGGVRREERNFAATAAANKKAGNGIRGKTKKDKRMNLGLSAFGTASGREEREGRIMEMGRANYS